MDFLADRNEVANPATANPCTVTSSASWAATAPLASLQTDLLADAAVSLTLGTADVPVWIELTWSSPIDLTYAGLFATNLRQATYVRMEAWADAAKAVRVATSTTADGRERKVVPPLTDPALIRAGAPNQMRGDLDPRDFRLLTTNVHVTVPYCRARVVRWTIWGSAYRPDDSADTGYRLGLAWAGDGISVDRQIGGSGEGVKSGDERIEAGGGAVWIEPGLQKRRATIDLAVAELGLRDALFKLALRAGRSRPVVWLPRLESLGDCFLYGGLFRCGGDAGHKYLDPEFVSTTLDLEEWRE